MQSKKTQVYASNIISPYHVVGVESFITSISSRGDIEGEVMLSKAHWVKPLIVETDIAVSNPNVSVVFAEPKFSFPSLLFACILLLCRNSSQANCYILGHSRVNLKLIAHLYQQGIIDWKTSFSTVVFDEGIGSYGGFRYRCKIYLHQAKSKWWSAFLFSLVHPINQLILRSKFLIDSDWQLLKIANQDIEENIFAIDGYRKYFKENFFCDITCDKSAVLLITQPTVELGFVDDEQYHSVISRLSEEIKSRNFTLYIKPHSAEGNGVRYKGLGARIVNVNSPVEALIGKLQPLLVLGLTSTALINSRLIIGVDSYSILPIFNNNGNDIKLINEDTCINEIFCHYVKKIHNWDKLANLLDNKAKLKTFNETE